LGTIIVDLCYQSEELTAGRQCSLQGGPDFPPLFHLCALAGVAVLLRGNHYPCLAPEGRNEARHSKLAAVSWRVWQGCERYHRGRL